MLNRRTFVLGAAATAAITSALPAHAAAAAPASGDTSDNPGSTAGVLLAPDGTPLLLAQRDGQWVLVDETGSVRITDGLAGADLVDVTGDGAAFTAVGAVSGDPIATIWESADAVTWREARRLHGVRSEFTAVGNGLALGSVVKRERASVVRIAARRTASGWNTVPVRGLEWTDGLSATAVATTADGWIAAAVDISGTVLHTSRDGVTWTTRPRLDGVAVRGLALVDGRVHWVGNEIVDATPLTGVLDADRTRPAVPQDAKALGVAGTRSGWFTGGRLITVEAAR
ncbi:hypothetical protein ALI22I_30015 [Saccharothrix sp. ALI-22-I]|uniref:hypothetical protein n=1 Tax=Saccharothrix sp. ALI-22-I TaxID=1933778 RepID=UPI00097C686B|nr:hypothetical protein [Saccharothrix sp. ALI-22-I]ONI84745.1 hypothetical protein ALI22I_30015 [Saccharothrix sp. ALI-22-I]